MKSIKQIDNRLKILRLKWLHSGIRDMNKYIPAINKLLDQRLQLTK